MQCSIRILEIITLKFYAIFCNIYETYLFCQWCDDKLVYGKLITSWITLLSRVFKCKIFCQFNLYIIDNYFTVIVSVSILIFVQLNVRWIFSCCILARDEFLINIFVELFNFDDFILMFSVLILVPTKVDGKCFVVLQIN